MAHGDIYWSECVTSDVEAAKAHYEKLAGWTFMEMPMEDGIYHVAMLGEKAVAGLMATSDLPDPTIPPHWMTYIAVDDIERAVDAANATGGTLLRPVFTVPQVGDIAMVKEPGGAVVGLLQPAEGG